MSNGENLTLKRFEQKLDRIRVSLDLMNKYGIDEEILETWIQAKTKLSKRDVQLMLKATHAFYNKLIAKEMCKSLEKEVK